MSRTNDKSQTRTGWSNFRIVLWWKLHIDTGEPLTEIPPKDHETSYFKVEGKKRPAIVWREGHTHSFLVMLTRTESPHVIALGKLKGADNISYFDPRRIERYPNKLKIHELRSELSKDQLRLFLEETDRFSMKTRTVEKNKRD